jgi:hypothetical protein
MKNFAHLREDSPFYPIFERGLVPIKNVIVPSAVRLEGSDETKAYMLDWSQCTEAQRVKIADLATRLRGGESSEFFAYMNGGGDMPIRVSQTTGVSTDAPFFL